MCLVVSFSDDTSFRDIHGSEDGQSTETTTENNFSHGKVNIGVDLDNGGDNTREEITRKRKSRSKKWLWTASKF